MQKVIALIVIVYIACGCTHVYSGKCGSNAQWTYDTKTREVVIEGTGVLNVPIGGLWDDWPSAQIVTIKEGIVELQEGCMDPFHNAHDVKLPLSCQIIGKSIFKNFKSLEHVDLGGVKVIGDFAFLDCWNLKKIELPQCIEIIGNSSFKNTGLIEISIPLNLKKLGEASFEKANLRSVSILAEIEEIPNCCFQDNSFITDIQLSKSIRKIGYKAFYDAGINQIELPDSLREIDMFAFAHCKLSDVAFPDSLKRVDWRAFFNCTHLRSIRMPLGYCYIDNTAFLFCDSINTVLYPSTQSRPRFGLYSKIHVDYVEYNVIDTTMIEF